MEKALRLRTHVTAVAAIRTFLLCLWRSRPFQSIFCAPPGVPGFFFFPKMESFFLGRLGQKIQQPKVNKKAAKDTADESDMP